MILIAHLNKRVSAVSAKIIGMASKRSQQTRKKVRVTAKVNCLPSFAVYFTVFCPAPAEVLSNNNNSAALRKMKLRRNISTDWSLRSPGRRNACVRAKMSANLVKQYSSWQIEEKSRHFMPTSIWRWKCLVSSFWRRLHKTLDRIWASNPATVKNEISVAEKAYLVGSKLKRKSNGHALQRNSGTGTMKIVRALDPRFLLR